MTKKLMILTAFLISAATWAGDLTVDNLTVSSNALFYGSASLNAPNGDLSMGTFTNRPLPSHCIIIDNVSGYGALNNESAFDVDTANDFTINFWMKAGSQNGTEIIRKSAGYNQAGWFFEQRSATAIWFFYDGSGGYSLPTISTNLGDNTWKMVTLIWRGSSSATATNQMIYVNGVFIPVSSSGDSHPMGSVLNNENLSFGLAEDGGKWAGYIDEFGFWNRQLTSNEIAALYNSGSGVYGNVANTPFNSGFVSGAHFDEGQGTNISTFGTSANGYLYGGCGWEQGIVDP